ncbi:VanW family protein [Faecalimicrobium sp. JNUCC 81]
MSNMKKNIYIGIGIVSVIVILFIGMTITKINGQKIVKNTYINGINVGGLTKEGAKSELEQKYRLKDLDISYLDKSWQVPYKDIDLSYDLDSTVENAYKLNKENNFMENIYKTIKSELGQKNNLNIAIDYNKDKLKNRIENIARDIDVDVKDASINISGSSIEINDSNSGLKVNVEESLKNIVRELEKGNTKEELVVTKVEPSITREQLQEVNTLLGSHTTKFDSSVSGRSTNIKLAANKSSDVLLMPGESFSYNEHTGMRTTANGYKNAPVIVQGVVQEGVGGGVCQVSSTLYNAALYSGVSFIELKNHSIPSTYVSKGRDATVTDSGIDFVFKNTLEHPIYVKNYVSGNTVTCQIYGSSKDKQNIQISTSIDGVSEAPIKKVEDPTILKGEEKQLEKGRNGYTVSTYRIYKDENGNVTKKEKVATSYYPKKQGVIAVGTMEKPEEKPPTETPKPPVTTPPATTPPVTPPQPDTPNPPAEVPPAENTQQPNQE